MAVFCLCFEEGVESGLDVRLVEGAVVAVLWEIGVVLGEEGMGLGGVASETGMGGVPDGETTFSEVVLKVVGCFPSNLNWESSVYGFCYFSLLFLYFSFKIVNIHNIFEGFVWG